ncbi:MAG: Npt1/Npt2 family nucleotide transporter [Bacteroidales bacterium]|nr:Npt1/Npt2 family nucleotide transporter [Bacteroidales bacterium]
MKALINKFYDIREGEWKLTLAFFSVSFLLMVVVYVLKPVRDSLFLVDLGARRLPYVFILIALVAIPVTSLISRSVHKYKSYRVFLWSNFLVILQLLILRQLFFLGDNWVYVLFYLWVGIFTILIVSQFWVFANEAYNTVQAKRLFPLINLGAILGAIAGSNATSAMITLVNIKTEDLLYISIAVLTIILLLTRIIYKAYEPDHPNTINQRIKKPVSPGNLKSLFNSKYQMIIAGIIGSAMFVSTLADYQLKATAISTFPEKAELTSFMGIFYGNVSLLALIIQIVISGRILRKIGLGGALTIRPAGLMIGAMLMAFEPILAFAVFLGGIDNASQYSIDKTGREILFFPFPQKVKERIKFFMDVVVDRLFKGFAGLLLLLLVIILEFNIRQIAVVTIIFSMIWLILSRIAQREYVGEFRKVLGTQYVDIKNDNNFNLSEPHTVQIIREQLNSSESSKVLRALYLLGNDSAQPFAEDLKPLLHHSLYEIRLLALKSLSKIPGKDFSSDILNLLKENDTEIRLESINYICMSAKGNPDEVLLDYLNSNSMLDKSSAIGCITKYGDETKRSWIKDEILEQIIADKSKENNLARAQTTQMLGHLKGQKAVKYLPALLNDPSPAVQKEAIKSMKAIKDPAFLPLLINFLFDKKLLPEVRQAVAAFGKNHVKTLASYLQKDKLSDDNFEAIVKTLSLMPFKATITHLIDALEKEKTFPKRLMLIKALNKLRTNHQPDLKFQKKLIFKALDKELNQSYLLLQAGSYLPDDKRFKLLNKLLQERRNQIKEHLFRLLGLIFDPNDLYVAFQGYRSKNEENRAAALELLDNLLKGKRRTLIMNILDPISDDNNIVAGRQYYGFSIGSYSEAMNVFINTGDNWLKAAALLGITPQCPAVLQDKLKEATNDNHPLIWQAARLTLSKNFKYEKWTQS